MDREIVNHPYDCSVPIRVQGVDFKIQDDRVSPPRCGNRLFPTSIALAQIILQGKHVEGFPYESSTVCAVGDGLGLLGIVASYKGAGATIIDRDEVVCELAKANARANRLWVEIRNEDWSRAEGDFDHIFGAEIIYPSYNLNGLAGFIKRAWNRKGLCVLGASKDMHEAEFCGGLKENGLHGTKYLHEFEMPNGVVTACYLWEVAP